jgi:hypothetical protein
MASEGEFGIKGHDASVAARCIFVCSAKVGFQRLAKGQGTQRT